MAARRPSGAGPGGFLDHAVEQLVLQLFELVYLTLHFVSMAHHGLSVAPGVAVLAVGHRRFGHQRTKPGLVGIVGEVQELLLGHCQIMAEALEPAPHLDQPPFDVDPRHGLSVRRSVNRPESPTKARPVTATRLPGAMRRPARFLASAALLGAALAGCSTSSAKGCGPERREALDPGYLQHVLPGVGVAPRYQTDPPTSGPHQPAPPITGVSTKPIAKPVQVGVLEAGKVLVQFKGISAAQARELKALAGAQVVVAAAEELPAGDKVVATAWTWKVACGGTDTVALRRFVSGHVGHGPDQS